MLKAFEKDDSEICQSAHQTIFYLLDNGLLKLATKALNAFVEY